MLNVGVFWLGFRLATARLVRWRDLLVGALIAAVIWQVLQVAGGYVVSHQLHRANELYGTFGVVLGLVAWLYLQAEATLWAAEVDVVLARRLWPVSVLDRVRIRRFRVRFRGIRRRRRLTATPRVRRRRRSGPPRRARPAARRRQ